MSAFAPYKALVRQSNEPSLGWAPSLGLTRRGWFGGCIVFFLRRVGLFAALRNGLAYLLTLAWAIEELGNAVDSLRHV